MNKNKGVSFSRTEVLNRMYLLLRTSLDHAIRYRAYQFRYRAFKKYRKSEGLAQAAESFEHSITHILRTFPEIEQELREHIPILTREIRRLHYPGLDPIHRHRKKRAKEMAQKKKKGLGTGDEQ